MWIRVLIGGGIGLLAGALLGYFGKCSSGTCPLTANPYRGAMFGLIIGVFFALSMTQGSCNSKEQQSSSVPHLATKDEFDEKVLKSPRPVLVDFYSDRCPPCRKLAPTISKLKDEYEGKADVFKVNTDNAKELALEYGITNIPTVMLFDKGEVVKNGKWIGIKDESTYRKAIDEALSKREGITE